MDIPSSDGSRDATTPAMLRRAIMGVLHELSEREQQIICARLGLYCQPKTLEEVGNAFGLTREQIRQIEAKTLAKLRHPRPLPPAA